MISTERENGTRNTVSQLVDSTRDPDRDRPVPATVGLNKI